MKISLVPVRMFAYVVSAIKTFFSELFLEANYCLLEDSEPNRFVGKVQGYV